MVHHGQALVCERLIIHRVLTCERAVAGVVDRRRLLRSTRGPGEGHADDALQPLNERY